MQRKALVVGINNYPACLLRGCENDAREFSAIMEYNGDNSKNFDVKLETNIQTKGQLKSLIIDLFSGQNEIALLYFSGHGHLDAKFGYLVTPDYSEHDLGVSMEEILSFANDSKTPNKIIILDCCHSGAYASFPHAQQETALLSDGTTILTASKKDESAIEVCGHGVFTNLLLEALRGGAADITGRITPGAVYSYIDQALGTWDQRPVFKTNVSKFLHLRSVNAPVPVERIKKLVDYFQAPNDLFQLDPSFEFTNDPCAVHEVKKPFAQEQNVYIFKDLQKYASVGLVQPVGEEHMYFAAMNNASCKLTPLGLHYWQLVKSKRI